MLIVILSLVLVAIGILIMCVPWYDGSDGSGVFGSVLFAVGIIALVIFGPMSIVTQCTKQTDYEYMVEERQMLVYRFETREENLTGNELLYDDILDFNRTIRKAKRYSKSLWTNWFTNDLIAELEPIDIYGGL